MKWSLVTGHDFARSIRWAKTQATINQNIRAMIATKPEIKVISRARFFAGGIRHYNYVRDETPTTARENSIVNSAEIEYNGIRLLSKAPQSAAEAERINNAIGA